MKIDNFNRGLLKFLDASPTPFHCVANLTAALSRANFVELNEGSVWSIETPGKYFVTRGDSSLIAFSLSSAPLSETGVRMVGSHTDSPCLKLKPNVAFASSGYWQLGVEVYGSALLNPWFDRDLSVAGRVTLQTASGELENRLVDFEQSIATIPSLAIHLDRDANHTREINSQTYLPPIVCLDGRELDLAKEIKNRIYASEPELGGIEIMSSDLSLYPTEPAAMIGLRREFIASARLDNLLSCYVGLCALLERLTENNETFSRTIMRSILISTDNAHGVHPNFPDSHDKQHSPSLNSGPVIKFNSNQAYASTSETAAIFQQACSAVGIPIQSFVSRSDMACGSTIGPLTATAVGVKTVDVGVATFAMHSIRELAGSEDTYSLYQALCWIFGQREHLPINL